MRFIHLFWLRDQESTFDLLGKDVHVEGTKRELTDPFTQRTSHSVFYAMEDFGLCYTPVLNHILSAAILIIGICHQGLQKIMVVIFVVPSKLL